MKLLFEYARERREVDANLRLAFIKLLIETGGWKSFKERVRRAKGTDARRQVYLDTCVEFGIEAAEIDGAIEEIRLRKAI